MAAEDPRSFVARFKPSSWDELIQLERQFGHWVFRGLSSAKWGFATSLERTARRYSFPSASLPTREKILLQLFQRAAHVHDSGARLPEKRNWLEWMSLLQHHGGPTRLLDFTESFYTALFFAVDGACSSEDCVVWGVDETVPTIRSRRHLGLDVFRDSWIDGQDELQERVNGFVGQIAGPPRLVCPVWPSAANPRLAAQQGLFLVPLRVDVPFETQFLETLEIPEDAFRAALEKEPERIEVNPDVDLLAARRVIRIDIQPWLHRLVRAELKRMNVTSTTLFHGLDGFSRSLKWEISWHEPGAPDFVPKNLGAVDNSKRATRIAVADLAEREE